MVLSAQMAKAGPPMNGKDLHVGDLDVRASCRRPRRSAIGTLTMAGMALAFAREGLGRVALSFIGEGGSSLGEWHEAINLCAARRLPAVFCVQNNQTALSTPVREQSAVRVFADKAAGYGIPGITIDGTDPDEIAAAFAWAVERARAGRGPALIELVCMRMCGHAHHDDMLYLGKDPQPSWDVSAGRRPGLREPRAVCVLVGARSDRRRTPRASRPTASSSAGALDGMKREADALVEREARRVIDAPWPRAEDAGERRAGGRAAARPRRGARSRLRRGAIDRSAGVAAARAGRAVRPEGPHVPRRRHARARATRSRPIRACSSSARTSAARTATRSCCCGRCSRSSATGS